MLIGRMQPGRAPSATAIAPISACALSTCAILSPSLASLHSRREYTLSFLTPSPLSHTRRHLPCAGRGTFLKRPFNPHPSLCPLLPLSFQSVRCAIASSSSGAMTTSLVLQAAADQPVVSVDWLHAILGEPDLKVLDASWYMPDEQRNPLQEYQVAHIPGACFFDIDGTSDRSTDLPHMLPSEEAFAAAVSAIGIHNKDAVVVYDGKGIFSAARVWWMFRVFGHDKVWVLDGGLPLWRASGYDVESNPPGDAILKANAASEATEKAYEGLSVDPMTFRVNLQTHLIWKIEQIKKNIEEQKFQHLDARSKGRFDGLAPEPRKGIRSGHVTGSKCIPFVQMLDGSQRLLPRSELAKRFEDEGVSLDHPIVTSCGTGVTACILALGLHRLGKIDVPIYDGSWTEWVLTPNSPVITV